MSCLCWTDLPLPQRLEFQSERAELKKRQFLAGSPLLSRRTSPSDVIRPLSDVIRVQPPSPVLQRSPAGRGPLLVTSPALRGSADQLLPPSDVTRLRVTSPAGQRSPSGGRLRSPSQRPTAR